MSASALMATRAWATAWNEESTKKKNTNGQKGQTELNITAGCICLNMPRHATLSHTTYVHNGDNGFGCFLFRTLFAAKWNIPRVCKQSSS